MTLWIIAGGVFVVFLLIFILSLMKVAGECSRQEDEAKWQKARADMLKSQMETAAEVKKELNAIDEEKKPEKKAKAAGGDSAARLARLNSLHDKAGTRD